MYQPSLAIVTLVTTLTVIHAPALADNGYVFKLITQNAPQPTNPMPNARPGNEAETKSGPRLLNDGQPPTAVPNHRLTSPDPLADVSEHAVEHPNPRRHVTMLTCVGEGVANVHRTATTTLSNQGVSTGVGSWSSLNSIGARSQGNIRFTERSHETTTAQTNWTEQIPFREQIGVNLDANDPRIRLPDHLTPFIRGGQGGWMKIRNLVVTNYEISGRIAVNLINVPRFRIDRSSGIMTIHGMGGSFTAICESINTRGGDRRF